MDCLRALVADDDAEILDLIKLILENAGFTVEIAKDGARALELLQFNPFEIIILDVMMPVLNGLETCRLIRQVSGVPILLLTAKVEEQDVLDGFEAGASDYVLKPFRPRELVARIQAVLGRSIWQPAAPPQRLTYDCLTLDLKARQVSNQSEVVSLTPTECQLLKYFILHQQEIITKADLLKHVWGCADISGDLNLVETAVRRLRFKIGDDPRNPRLIFTVWGTGYRFGRPNPDLKTVSNLSVLSVA